MNIGFCETAVSKVEVAVFRGLLGVSYHVYLPVLSGNRSGAGHPRTRPIGTAGHGRAAEYKYSYKYFYP